MKTSLSVAQNAARVFVFLGTWWPPSLPTWSSSLAHTPTKELIQLERRQCRGGGSILRKRVDSNQTGKFLIFIFFVPHMFYLVFISICFAHIYSVSDLFLSAAFVAQILLTYCTPSLKKNCLF